MLKTLSRIVYVLFVIALIASVVLLKNFDVLPNSYLIAIVAIFVIIILLLGFINLKVKNRILYIIFMLIEIAIMVGISFASYTVYKTDKFLAEIPKVEEEVFDYYLIVRKDSNYKTLSDLTDKEIMTYSVNDQYYQDALSKLQKVLTAKFVESDDLFNSIDKLLNNDGYAIFISSFYKTIMDEEIENFKDNTKILELVTKRIPKDETNDDNKDNTTQNVQINKDVYTVFISGIDTSGSINKVSRSDVNIVVTVNTKTHKVLLTSIPRDYYVQLHGTSGYKDKLTHAGIYGIDKSITTIEDLLDIDINYYIRVNFDTVVKLVDAIGGIDVYSEMSFQIPDACFVQKGLNHFNGEQTLLYVRQRKIFAAGDRKRGEHQEAVIEAIVNKVSQSKVLLGNYFEILDSLKGNFQTSISTEMIKYFVKKQLEEMPTWTFERINLDGTGAMDYTYSIPNMKLYVMVPNQDTIQQVKQAIKEIQKT